MGKQQPRQEAQKAYALALEAVEYAGVTAPEHQFLWKQKPVRIDDQGRVVLIVGSRDELAKARGMPALARVARQLRNAKLASGLDYEIQAGPPRTVADATHTLPTARPGKQRVVFLPHFLVCHTLPHRAVGRSEFSRVNGQTRVTLLAPKRPGLPYGTYPRIILMHLTTRALRSGMRTIPAAETFNGFLRLMGIANSGGTKGASTRARQQFERLRQTTFSLHDFRGREVDNIPILDHSKEFGSERLLVVLGERFFKMVCQRSIPLDRTIVQRLRRSPLALDLYAWLTYRVTTVKPDTTVPWASLMAQFGAEYRHQRQFRWRLRQSLDRVKREWPGLRAEPELRGLRIVPGAPSVLDSGIRQMLNRR